MQPVLLQMTIFKEIKRMLIIISLIYHPKFSMLFKCNLQCNQIFLSKCSKPYKNKCLLIFSKYYKCNKTFINNNNRMVFFIHKNKKFPYIIKQINPYPHRVKIRNSFKQLNRYKLNNKAVT